MYIYLLISMTASSANACGTQLALGVDGGRRPSADVGARASGRAGRDPGLGALCLQRQHVLQRRTFNMLTWTVSACNWRRSGCTIRKTLKHKPGLSTTGRSALSIA